MGIVGQGRRQIEELSVRPSDSPPQTVMASGGRTRAARKKCDTGSPARDLQRFIKLLRLDPQLQFLRADRERVLTGLESSLQGKLAESSTIDLAELARSMAAKVVTPELKRLVRELLEDSIRFRPWKPAELCALTTALTLVTFQGEAGDLEANPIWIALVALSVEDLVSVEHFLSPAGLEAAEASPLGAPLGSPELTGLLERSGQPGHFVFQRFFTSAHRVARLITQEKLQVVVRLYEILPMFVSVFRVWADQSAYGQLPAQMLPSLHADVIAAFHEAAERTIDLDVQLAIAGALEAEAGRALAEDGADRREEIVAASQFSASFSWEHNPIVTQLLLRLCSSPEICCIGPGAAEAVKLAGDPTVPEYYHGYGQALLRQGELRAAGRVFAAGLEFLGNHWRGLCDLALVYRALGEAKVARRTFKEALAAEDADDDGRAAIRAAMKDDDAPVALSRAI